MVQRNRILDLFFLALQLHALHAAATCYAPDGTAVTDPSYQPCISIVDEFSMCCRLNDTDPDQCLPNGLCYWASRQEYWRDYCTDETWESPNCLSNLTCDSMVSGRIVCPGPWQLCFLMIYDMLTIVLLQNGGSSNGTARLHRCPNGTYCCGWTDDCCTPVGELSLKATLVAIGNNSSSAASATPTTTGDPNGGDNKIVAVGVGVGVSLGAISVAMLGAGFLWGRRKTKATYQGLQQAIPEGQMSPVAPRLPGSSPVYEASNSPAPVHFELPGSK